MPFTQRQSRYWGISWYEGLRQVKRSSGTEDWFEAKRLEHEKRAQSRRQRESLPRHSFNVMMDRYLEDITDLDHHDRTFYATQRLIEHFDGRSIPDLKQSDYLTYRKHRRQQGAAESTIDKELRTLSAAGSHARNHWNWPLAPLRIQLARRQGRIRWINKSEAARLIKAAKESNQGKAGYLANFIILALNTGMRHRELLNLEWSRVDFHHELIYLAPADQKGKRHSSVPINGAAIRALQRQLGQSKKYVFVYKGKKIQSVRKSFATACRQAELPDLHVHDLRHTFVSWMVQSGVPLRTVQEAARHQSIETTTKYAHLSPEHVRQAVKSNSFG